MLAVWASPCRSSCCQAFAGTSYAHGAGQWRSPTSLVQPFRVCSDLRLAADAVGFFTIRGLAGEPLKVLLLYDRIAPEITSAAVALERLAFAIMGLVLAALISLLAITRLSMPAAWDTMFILLIAGAAIVLGHSWHYWSDDVPGTTWDDW